MGQSAQRGRKRAEQGFPADPALRQLHLRPEYVGHAIQQRIFVLEMTINGHWINPQLLGEFAHGERLQPLLVDQLQAGLENALAGEWAARCRRCYLSLSSFYPLGHSCSRFSLLSSRWLNRFPLDKSTTLVYNVDMYRYIY